MIASGAVTAPVPAVAPVVVPALTTVAVARAMVVTTAEVLPGRLTLDDLDRDQRQLAPVIHIADLDLDLVADRDDVVDVLDPRPAM